MRAIALTLATLGGLTVLGTAFVAVDSFMTDARKSAVRADINDSLDAGAARYEEDTEDGCFRRCAGSGAHFWVSLRDGLFLSRPFDPNAAMPDAPDGWRVAPYSLAAAETIMGRDIRRTRAPAETNNALLLKLDRIATKGSYSAVQIYTLGESQIAFGIAIDRDGVRKAKDGEVTPDNETAPVFMNLAGLPVRVHKQTSYDWRTSADTPVAYQHYTMNLDDQVNVLVLALGETDDVTALLSAFDVSSIAKSLPHSPTGFDPLAAIQVSELQDIATD